MLEGQIQGKKVYVRPRTMFLDWLLKMEEGNISYEELKMLAQNRSIWSQWRWMKMKTCHIAEHWREIPFYSSTYILGLYRIQVSQIRLEPDLAGFALPYLAGAGCSLIYCVICVMFQLIAQVNISYSNA